VNILVVEDQTVTRELMILVADAAFPGATVRAAGDLASALSGAKSMTRLDMVLLDLGLPDSQGLDGLLRFRADFPQAKIVIVSSQDNPEVIADALDAGGKWLYPEETGDSRDDCCAKTRGTGGVYHPPGFARPPSGKGHNRPL
jgi:DNA-binding NarL/FixJ family response regulator